jgi:hypothetical protein
MIVFNIDGRRISSVYDTDVLPPLGSDIVVDHGEYLVQRIEHCFSSDQAPGRQHVVYIEVIPKS